MINVKLRECLFLALVSALVRGPITRNSLELGLNLSWENEEPQLFLVPTKDLATHHTPSRAPPRKSIDGTISPRLLIILTLDCRRPETRHKLQTSRGSLVMVREVCLAQLAWMLGYLPRYLGSYLM